MSTAKNAVFGTPELLEDILITALLQGMTQRELLLVQRVSRTFKATIEGSPLLQKALFFRPATTEQDLEFFRQWALSGELYLPFIIFNHDATGKISTTKSDNKKKTVAFRNSLIGGFPDLPTCSKSPDHRYYRDTSTICSDKWYQAYLAGKFYSEGHKRCAKRRRKLEKWLNPVASRHRMFTCQPPTLSGYLKFCRRSDLFNPNPNTLKRTKVKVQDSAGIRAGPVFNTAMRYPIGVGRDEPGEYSLDIVFDFGKDVEQMLLKYWEKAQVEMEKEGWYIEETPVRW